MQRRTFIAAATAAGIAAATQSAQADIIVPGQKRRPVRPPQIEEPRRPAQRFILLETYFTASPEKRDALVAKFDEILIPERNKLGFETVGVFTVNQELHRDDRGYDAAKFDNAVFVVQDAPSIEALADFQARSVELGSNAFNATDDLDFIDEEIVALRAFPTQPKIEVPTKSADRVIQLRTYNSPNYERNFAKEKMFDVRGELDLFRRCQMAPVFFGTALFGSMAPNVTYMLSFPNDEARRKGWDEFVNSAEWKEMSGEKEFARTATRIRNLFLKPSPKSQI